MALVDPSGQWYPAAHGPDGVDSPGRSQNCPAVHLSHAPEDVSPAPPPNVPAGQRGTVAPVP